MNKRVLVEIEAQEVIKYKQTVEMLQEQFDKLNSELMSNNHRVRSRAEESVLDYLDRHDVYDWDDPEVDIFEIAEEG